jgi:hypothetical protein
MLVMSSRAAALQACTLAILTLLLAACSGHGSSHGSTPPGTLVITTSALANGQVGKPYSSKLAASGGTAPYTWTLGAGSLPAGLALDAASGTISGTPTAIAARLALTFTVTDAAAGAHSATLPLAISPATLTLTVAPARAGLTLQQALSLAASTNDEAGVSWSIAPAGGSFSASSSLNGAAVQLTAPAAPGVYTVSATSLTDASVKAQVSIGVTDLTGVFTYHNDLARDGVNAQEYALTPANVNSGSFGKLFSCTVDGAVYAQPLWVASLKIGTVMHNVVFVATQHDGLFAFDADQSPCLQLWKANLIDSTHGAAAGETTVPAGTADFLVGAGPPSDITPEVGVTGTPVIDPARGILYVVSKSVDAGRANFYQRLHAIDLTTGNEMPGSPVAVSASYATAGGASVSYSARNQNQRPGLALINSTVYIASGSHDDVPAWYGWIIGYSYNGSAFTRSAALNVSPNLAESGIWMSGGAPSVDSAGHLYVITGNGGFNVTNSSGPTNDYGDSFLQLTGALAVSSWFTPSSQDQDNLLDRDFGAGGSALVLNQNTGAPQHLVVGGGKDGILYLLDGDAMGGFGDPQSRQNISLSHGIFATGAFWNNTLYINPVSSPMLALAFNPTTKMFATTPVATGPASATLSWPGATPSVSASGPASNGIIWAIDSHNYCTAPATTCLPAVLHAFDATNLATELWNSSTVPADAAGNAVKFTVPTVANGKVYVGTRGNNTGGTFGSTTVSGQLDVYGLKP